MKKGSTHTDWVISFGIFFIYLMFMFVFIKPTYHAPYSGGALLNIAKEGLMNDTDFIITKTPLFFECSQCAGQPAEQVVMPFPFDFDDFCLVRKDTGQSAWYQVAGNNLKMRTEFTVSKNMLYIIYSPERDVDCGTELPANCNDEAPICREVTLEGYTYGLTEYLKGISLSKFDKLPGYESLKTSWKYPNQKDFAIFIYDTNQETIIKSLNKGGYDNITASDENVEIFVEQWVDQILYDNSTFKSVIVNLRVW